MKRVYIKEFHHFKTEFSNCDKFVLEENIREGGVMFVNIVVTNCSCNTEYLNSEYLFKKKNFTYGEGSSAIDRSLELALSFIKQKETAEVLIEISGDYIHENLHQNTVNFECKINYDIITNAKYVYEYTGFEKLCVGKRYKQLSVDKINEVSKSQQYDFHIYLSAFFLLCRAIKWLALIETNELDNENIKILHELKSKCYNNLSYIHLNFKNYNHAVFAATVVLNYIPNNIKALYRRAIAQMNLHNYELSFADLQLLLKKEPSNVAAKKQMALLVEKNRSHNMRYSEAMKKFLAFS